jgi:hypothetical protein
LIRFFETNLRAPIKIRFFRKIFRRQIFEQVSLLDIGAREQIWERKNYQKSNF